MLVSLAFAQAPTNNPFTALYPKYRGQDHWTDSLRWSNVYVVTDHGIVPNDNIDDLENLNALIATVSTAGGGVIFFPEGEYNFSDTLILKSGVVLRGPASAEPSALSPNFRPLAKLLFPKYEHDTTLNGGAGQDIRTAFKEILAEDGAKNIAVVDLDINRAAINVHPKNWVHVANPKGTGGTIPGGVVVNGTPGTIQPAPGSAPRNVLVLGVRSNNVAFPDPNVPNANQRPWQRWSWRFAANVDIFVEANGIVANCRINDDVTDSFSQPNYRFGNANTCRNIPADGSGAVFSYTDHYGISLNRGKITKLPSSVLPKAGGGPNNPLGVYGMIASAEPEDEPYLFSPGNLVLDNYVYRTMRIGITAGGNGLEITGNIIKDQEGKEIWITPNGTSCQGNYSATYENRGIDWSGFNIKVNNNQLEAFNHYFPSSGRYYSIDGEGILYQECCGGSRVSGVEIKNNQVNNQGGTLGTNPGISIYKSRGANRVTIVSNNFLSRSSLYIDPAPNGGSMFQNDIRVDSNTNVNALLVEGRRGGTNISIKYNTASFASPTLTAPCWADLEGNDPTFQLTLKDANGNNTTQPCTSPEAFNIRLIEPTNDTIIDPAQTPVFRFNGVVEASDISGATVFPVINQVRLQDPVTINSDGTFEFDWTIPSPQFTRYLVTFRLERDGQMLFSNPVWVTVGAPLSIPVSNNQLKIGVYPNPAQHELYVTGWDYSSTPMNYQISSIEGKQVANGVVSERPIELGTLKSGVYLLRLSNSKGSSILKIVKN